MPCASPPANTGYAPWLRPLAMPSGSAPTDSPALDVSLPHINSRQLMQYHTDNGVRPLFQLRYLQTLNAISAENNSTIIFPLPVDVLAHLIPKHKEEE